MTFEPIIRSQSDLYDAWSTLMQPLGFSRPSVWMMLIGPDDRAVPRLTEIEEAEQLAAAEELSGLAEMLRVLRDEIAPGCRFAFLRSRPGAAGLTVADRAWARALYEAGRIADAPVEVVHRACDVDLVPIPMNEVLTAA